MSTKKLQIIGSLGTGGNADTLDGKHADEFALASDVSDLQTLIGDTTVSEQVDVALANINNLVYVSEENQESAVVPLNADTLGGVPAERYAKMSNTTPRNLLDNSDFTNPVNQRGLTSYVGSGYCIDRWRTFHASATVTTISGGINVMATDINSNIYQALNVEEIDTTKKMTAAACDIDGNIYIWCDIASESSYAAPICVYISNGRTLFRLARNTTWKWAALYYGEYTLETLPEYQPKGYGVELAECKRYYQKYQNAVTIVGHPGFIYDSTQARVILNLNSGMVISASNIPNIDLVASDITILPGNIAVSNISIGYVSEDKIVLLLTISGGTVGNTCVARIGKAFSISADL